MLEPKNGAGRAIENADHFTGGMTIPDETLEETVQLVARHVRQNHLHQTKTPSSALPAASTAAASGARDRNFSLISRVSRKGQEAGQDTGQGAEQAEAARASKSPLPQDGHSSSVSRQGKALWREYEEGRFRGRI